MFKPQSIILLNENLCFQFEDKHFWFITQPSQTIKKELEEKVDDVDMKSFKLFFASQKQIEKLKEEIDDFNYDLNEKLEFKFKDFQQFTSYFLKRRTLREILEESNAQ